MKNLKLGISALALTVATTVSAQTTSNPWLIGVGAHGVNHVAAGGSAGDVFKTAFTGKSLYNINNFTITPPLSKLTVARNLNKALVLDWQTSVGNIDNKRIGMGKEFMLMTGLGLQLKFAGLLFGNEDAWFDPYVRVGANYLRHDYTGLTFPVTDSYNDVTYAGYSENKPYTQGRADHFALSTGLGTNIWLTKNFGLGIQGDYVSTPVDKSRLANFWQASASLNFRFGNRDKDKDGVLDKDDLCPETPGLPEFQGCPDTDGDGVPDKDDNCLEVAGPVENNGCPWPDTDNDGVLDKDDACPEVAGPVENNGCPWPDTDNDGVLDKDDKCPSVPGLPEYNGCPKPRSEYAKDATGALQGIFFHFNKSSIRPESNTKLDQAAEVIKSSNGGTFLVVGHTDVKGNANYNLKLSRERAASVVAALEARGVSPSQLKSKGVGSAEATVPASASNEERMKDRKVVVEAISGSAWEALQKSDLPVVKKKVVKKKRK
ncbi:OmpA family protein [Riemerella anatipestifer]|nr:OmpA family protein [Riemerella anatipestifer]MRM95912.1 OmpA family protein [Riemerella anatipestifer]MRN00068.1 OmpA family protein [Riemerella anatipestifer]MRN02284.1 OmpA family protein [Riemerella anatipestifer]